MTWDNTGHNTERLLKNVVTVMSVLLLALIITTGLQIYVLQPGSRVHPATGLLVLFLAPWIGIVSLASAVLIPVALLIRAKFRYPRWMAPPDHDHAEERCTQPATADNRKPLLAPALLDQELMLIAGSECQCPWEELQAALTMPSNDNVENEPTEEREVCEYVGR